MDFDGLLRTLPDTEFAFAYGSGVFEQKGYENAKSAPMVDMVFATKDSLSWHTANLRRNPSHYSMLSKFGPSFITHIQEDFGAGLYYNTLIPMPSEAKPAPGQQMKYGVMSLHTLVDDLLHWRSMYVSGRLHKPVKILRSSHDLVMQAARENLRHALRAALLMLPASFTAEQLFLTIAGLSYTGDFRMVFGENPNKVSNIVTKNMHHFQALYEPVIAASFPTLMVQEVGGTQKYTQDMSSEATLALGMALPYNLQRRMAEAFFTSRDVRTGVYATLMHRFRGKRLGVLGRNDAVPVHTLRDFNKIQAQRIASEQQELLRSYTPTLPHFDPRAPSDVGGPLNNPKSMYDSHDMSGGQGRGGGASTGKLLESLRRAPGARAIAYAEAGRQMMQRLRNQRLQYMVARRDRRSGDAALSQISRDTLTHLLEGDSTISNRNYALAAQDPRIVAFWDEVLKADPRAEQRVITPLRFGGAHVSRIAQEMLRPAISHIVGSHARTQSIKGIITAGPVKATVYAWQKLDKFFKAVLGKVKK